MTTIEELVYTSVFNSSEDEKNKSRLEIRKLAEQNGILPASIHDIYMRYGKGELKGFTVPAFNVRNLTFDFSRLLFRLMKEKKVGYAIFEITRGEVGYIGQTHDEFTTTVLTAAIAEEWVGPVYIQADHTQFSAEKYKQDPLGQLEIIKQFIKKAVDAGFYNIDIDASTLVNLEKSSLIDQQQENAKMTAVLLDYIREIEPKGITVSIGGEIGHIGGKNSTVEEYKAFMELVKSQQKSSVGLSKVSVQTGTSHGGIVLPDGTIKQAVVDFSVIESIGKVAKEVYGMGGVVQHGASTLPTTLFHRFPEVETLEIHLATGFQNIIFQHMPTELKKEIYAWLDVNCADERKEGQTDEQFYYKTRKKANGPFKEKIWKMEPSHKQTVMSALEEEVKLILHELKVENTV
ncbi:aldolase [Candidatus Roizmanbacteria bacterium CG03_land_8_20_14_0_80_39_12]|uniref:Aldolase n=1 Tax=Candidatus Roizmanbacteria bacterium CG03_land_8_20_14_0_80_39_12 TaxID=1974847 RepID=A0A2M7BR12_9BACT|nr:MAG: aldolase [Candidatus Roizmanbacteria bacterium CG03_land_8_20_14_0_80_39_12]